MLLARRTFTFETSQAAGSGGPNRGPQRVNGLKGIFIRSCLSRRRTDRLTNGLGPSPPDFNVAPLSSRDCCTPRLSTEQAAQIRAGCGQAGWLRPGSK